LDLSFLEWYFLSMAVESLKPQLKSNKIKQTEPKSRETFSDVWVEWNLGYRAICRQICQYDSMASMSKLLINSIALSIVRTWVWFSPDFNLLNNYIKCCRYDKGPRTMLMTFQFYKIKFRWYWFLIPHTHPPKSYQ